MSLLQCVALQCSLPAPDFGPDRLLPHSLRIRHLLRTAVVGSQAKLDVHLSVPKLALTRAPALAPALAPVLAPAYFAGRRR